MENNCRRLTGASVLEELCAALVCFLFFFYFKFVVVASDLHTQIIVVFSFGGGGVTLCTWEHGSYKVYNTTTAP